MPLRFVSQELRESRRIAMEASCNLGERGDMLFDDYLDRSCSRLGEARQMANKSNPGTNFAEGSLEGQFLMVSAGLTVGAIPNPNNPRFGRGLPGIGLSVSYTQMGGAISIGWPPGITFGRDKSISATVGSATVTDFKITDCCGK
jgi:hypothetical protein